MKKKSTWRARSVVPVHQSCICSVASNLLPLEEHFNHSSYPLSSLFLGLELVLKIEYSSTLVHKFFHHRTMSSNRYLLPIMIRYTVANLS